MKFAIQDWCYMDFSGRVIALPENHRSFGLMSIPANRHIDRLVKEVFKGYVTFKEYLSYIREHVPKYVPEYKYLNFDGRIRNSVYYEPLDLSPREFAYVMNYDSEYNFIIEKMRVELMQKTQLIERLQSQTDAPKSLVDLAINSILNGVDILKKYNEK